MPKASTTRHPLRIGIVGAGRMALNHIRAAHNADGRARVLAVADPNPGARARLATVFPSISGFPDLEAMLAAGPLDAVHIVTPPDTHVPLALQALDHGLHVYVEKPFAGTASDARRILDTAARQGLVAVAGHQMLFEPPTRRVDPLLSGLGRIVHVESYFSFRTVRHIPGGRAPLQADRQLFDILPHPVYLLQWVLQRATGAPASIRAIHVGPEATVHALVQAGAATGTLVVTLAGRPVESYLRIVGTRGSVLADYVRGTVQTSIGPGTSGIDKLLAPYRLASQLLTGTTTAMARRVVGGRRHYPGLGDLLAVFYDAIRGAAPTPVPPDGILNTVEICEAVARALADAAASRPAPAGPLRSGPAVLVTGGTGMLGKALVRVLRSGGHPVRVVARREPPYWERLEGVEYVLADLGEGVPDGVLSGIETVVHCAAEMAGGWEEHQRNSVDATEHCLRAAARAGVRRFVQVSSLAVLEPGGRVPISDDHPLRSNSRTAGPYVWGKLESERLAVRLGGELGVEVKVVRPGALVDASAFDPPGRLGKRVGGIFVAVGSPRHRLGTTDLAFAAEALAWMLDHWGEVASPVNLVDPDLPTKRDLIRQLRAASPGVRVVWLPTLLLVPLSGMAVALQKLLRPRRPAINIGRVFAVSAYDPARARSLQAALKASASASGAETASAAARARALA